MNFDIRFDFQRRERLGLIEAIWGQDKSIDQLKRLSENVLGKNEVVFITRINSEKAFDLLDLYDDARFYEEANCLIIGENLYKINTIYCECDDYYDDYSDDNDYIIVSEFNNN